MEGLFDPFHFPFPKSIDTNRLLKSIVKVRPLRTLEYAFFETEDEASNFSETILSEEGLETIRYGLISSDKEKINDPEFSQALFTHEFCEAYKNNNSFPMQTSLKGNGNGVFVSGDGYIATNFHLISGAVDHLKKTDSGYFEAPDMLIKNIEIEFAQEITSEGIVYRKAKEVFLAGTYSKTDAYGKRLDLAILKINESTPNFLPLAKTKIQRFDRIYSVGFSMRTARREEKKRLLGYTDANYDLRVSTGIVVKLESENSFLSDSDGAPGNSGSVAINEDGSLVGIYCGSTGNGIVDPAKSYRRYVFAEHLVPLLKNKI